MHVDPLTAQCKSKGSTQSSYYMQEASLSHELPTTRGKDQDDVVWIQVKEVWVAEVVRKTASVCTRVSWLSGTRVGMANATGEVPTLTLEAATDISAVTSEGVCTSTSDDRDDRGAITGLRSGPAVAVEVPGGGEDSWAGTASGSTIRTSRREMELTLAL